MPQKPDKFGIKFWILAEVDSKYLVNGFPYLGKDNLRPPNRLLGEHVILELGSPIFGKGYNITCDNFFTSLKLILELQKMSRRDYILELSKELIKSFKNTTSKDLKITTGSNVNIDVQTNIMKRHQCQGNQCKGNKTKNKCNVCEKYICGKCSNSTQVHTCLECTVET